ncbi:MAG TPA: UDP-N-acetylmuramoyl-L-alanine--D-glutamate ligase [bacterium]|nr:UDP-N-acetylmuramoyl-L-alanine--D-glutamate ligase [bacterium]
MGVRTPQELRSQKILVVGLARSGIAAVELLLRSGASVVAADLRSAEELGLDSLGWSDRGVELRLGSQTPDVLTGVDLVVLSPGVPLTSPIPTAASERGVRTIGELELAYSVSSGKWLAVTGTNGKTTTTALLGELVGTTGAPVAVAGNIGLALSGEVERVPADGYVVAEVSSFQLDTIERFSPHVGVLLNITEDHLDRYESFEHYGRSKARVFENQDASDFAVLNFDDARVAALESTVTATVIPVSAERELEGGVFVRGGTVVSQVGGSEREIVAAREIGIPGPHNLSNALMATAAAAAIGVTPEDAARVLRSFNPLEHRLEGVAEVDGVRYVNDSKATNVDAVGFALQSFDAPIVLIAGGKDKGTDYAPLGPAVAGRVKRLILIGEATEKMERALGSLVPTERAATLEDAVLAAREAASTGDVVLLSPACASFDMFDDFEDRGRQFKDLVASMARGAATGGGN